MYRTRALELLLECLGLQVFGCLPVGEKKERDMEQNKNKTKREERYVSAGREKEGI